MGASFYKKTGVQKDNIENTYRQAMEAATVSAAQAETAIRKAAEASGHADAAAHSEAQAAAHVLATTENATSAKASEAATRGSQELATRSATEAALSASSAAIQAASATSKAAETLSSATAAAQSATTATARASEAAASARAAADSAAIAAAVPVKSVAGRTGEVVLTTSDVAEGSRLYHTTARASAAAPVQSVAGKTGAVVLSTSDVAEGSQQYHTTARAAAAAPVQSVAGKTGAVVLSTSDVAEGSHQYHTAARAAAAAPVQSVAGKTGAVVLAKTDVGLGNVDNTADANKPISAAAQEALNQKANAAEVVPKSGGSFTGNVGIGTTSPVTSLHIRKDAQAAGLGNNPLLFLENGNGSSFDQRAEIHFKNTGQVTSAISSSYTVFGSGQYGGDLILATKGHLDASLEERFRITSQGRAGLGTRAPLYPLDIMGPSGIVFRAGSGEETVAHRSAALLQMVGGPTPADRHATLVLDPHGADGVGGDYGIVRQWGNGEFEIQKAAAASIRLSSAGTVFTRPNGSETLRLDPSGHMGMGTSSVMPLGFSLPTFQIRGPVTSRAGGVRFTSSDSSLELAAYAADGLGYISMTGSHPLTFQTGNTERVRLDAAGNLLVNTTTASPTNSNSTLILGGSSAGTIALQRLGASDMMRFWVGGVQAGSITSTLNATTYNTSSDYRLSWKAGHVPLENSGDFIDALNPRYFPLVEAGGFIAHEFQEVSPSSVTGAKDQTDAEGRPVFQSMQASSPEVMANIVAELQSLRRRVAGLEEALRT